MRASDAQKTVSSALNQQKSKSECTFKPTEPQVFHFYQKVALIATRTCKFLRFNEWKSKVTFDEEVQGARGVHHIQAQEAD